MKTLDQIEARTVISSLPYTITNPGSYYFIKNLTASGSGAGITVSTNNVTIDLNGFALIGGIGTNAAINVSLTRTNLCVRNGTITGWTSGGIAAGAVFGSLFEKLRLIANSGGIALWVGPGSTIKECVATGNTSTSGTGFQAGNSCTVVDCTAYGNGGNGFYLYSYCTIANSTAGNNGGDGMDTLSYCTVSHCTFNGSQYGLSGGGHNTISQCTFSLNTMQGLFAGPGSTVESCTASSNGIGITGSDGCSVHGCTARDNQNSGIALYNRCHAVGNTCDNNNLANDSYDAGIVAFGNGSRIERNTLSANNNAGVLVVNTYTGNIVIGNTFAGAEYIIPSGNTVGPLIESTSGSTLSATASPLANIHIQ